MNIYAQLVCRCESDTTSTTTTSTTTLTPNIFVTNDSLDGTINQLLIGGNTPTGITLPIGPGETASGTTDQGEFISGTIQIGGTWGSFTIVDSSGNAECNNFDVDPFLFFIDIENVQPVEITVVDTSC